MHFFTLAIAIFATSTLAAPAPAAINPDWMGGILNILNRPHGKVSAEASASPASSSVALGPTPSPTVGTIVPLLRARVSSLLLVVARDTNELKNAESGGQAQKSR
ncbi:hypothetical protein BDV37DRAFT_285704 [Aspergillus pseudonomiae]|uniref:Uncharacterized protein n=1 Tax=Aspergillus pseudonomiae TaxID=1506151 RepID=A0A5N7D4T4_9EURO|nr:uncharacterized protein BDV37DRAFT_285704 [Aspergillus pseudonomiae]KAE8401420.1 hypothetical protein BDV37DRAFT_285704 [Aspergillus pseudonomiae]